MYLLGNTKASTGIACDGGCQIETSRDLCGEYQKQPGSYGNRNVQSSSYTAADTPDRNQSREGRRQRNHCARHRNEGVVRCGGLEQLSGYCYSRANQANRSANAQITGQ